jgi:uncharacterized protein YjbJ (UPF0337 family)
MNQDIIKGKWSQIRGKLKEKWSKLTDDDLGLLEGHRDYLVGKVQERYGIAKDEANRQIDDWAGKLKF